MWSLALIILHEKKMLLHTFVTNLLKFVEKVFLVNKLCPANNLMLQGEDRGIARQPEGRT